MGGFFKFLIKRTTFALEFDFNDNGSKVKACKLIHFAVFEFILFYYFSAF